MTTKDSATGQVTTALIDSTTMRWVFSGYWTKSANIPPLEPLIKALKTHPSVTKIVTQTENLAAWDSRFPAYLVNIQAHCQTQKIELDLSGLPSGIQALFDLAQAVPAPRRKTQPIKRPPFPVVVGTYAVNAWRNSLDWIEFVGELVIACGRLLSGKARFRSTDLWLCIQDAGPAALPIVTLISLLVGLILAFVGAVQLAMFGAQIFIADLVGLGTVREMGALMTAVIMTGRTGAAYAAQLGTMQVNNEIDALKTMGISATEFLVLPRVFGLVLMMPLLCLYANLIAIAGGALVTYTAFDVSLNQYYHEITRAVHLTDFAIGLGKSVVFAFLIAIAGCMRGMRCGRSASAVGDATTAAVVSSIVMIVVADSVLTLLCNQLGI